MRGERVPCPVASRRSRLTGSSRRPSQLGSSAVWDGVSWRNEVDGAEFDKDAEGVMVANVTWQLWQVVLYLEGCENKVDDTSHTTNLGLLRTNNAIPSN